MIKLNRLELDNPFLIGAGAAKYGRGYALYENPLSAFAFKSGAVRPENFGGVVTKTITLYARKGNYSWYAPWKCLKKIPLGWANRFSWSNCGIENFVRKVYPKIKLPNLIVSIGAVDNMEEIFKMIKMLNGIKIKAIELNISCPSMSCSLNLNYERTDVLSSLFEGAVKLSKHPLTVKLGPINRPFQKAKIAEEAGIDATSCINTYPHRIKGFGDCGISGEILKTTALNTIKEIKESSNIPIIGGGGITDAESCKKFFDVGASAVFFSSIFLKNPLLPERIIKELSK